MPFVIYPPECGCFGFLVAELCPEVPRFRPHSWRLPRLAAFPETCAFLACCSPLLRPPDQGPNGTQKEALQINTSTAGGAEAASDEATSRNDVAATSTTDEELRNVLDPMPIADHLGEFVFSV